MSIKEIKEMYCSPDLDYRIVIPSRKRTDNMKNMLEMFPMATILVAWDEYDDYLSVVPDENLERLPKDFKGGSLPRIVNYMWRHYDEECIISIDDDLKLVRALVGFKNRKITDTENLVQILENQIRICKDLGLSFFFFTNKPNPMSFLPHEPLKFMGDLLSGCFGQIGRKFMHDEEFMSKGDVDLCMQVLKTDRVYLIDTRFFWDFGEIYGGKGGLQGVRTSDNVNKAKERLKQKWGDYVLITERGSSNKLANKDFVAKKDGISIKVRRKSDLFKY